MVLTTLFSMLFLWLALLKSREHVKSSTTDSGLEFQMASGTNSVCWSNIIGGLVLVQISPGFVDNLVSPINPSTNTLASWCIKTR